MFAYGIVLALIGAACGGAAASSGAGGSGHETVSVRTIQGVGSIYTDAHGMALYTPTQEANGKIMCTGPCTTIWIPLAAPASGSLAAASGVHGNLGVVTRPDGTKQVTLDGAPLYRFYQDMAPGTVNGNGIMDSFGGVSFTWHVESGGSAVKGNGSGSYGY
jgi:predicted lipoprotein with Yx(FWY)xxD motif